MGLFKVSFFPSVSGFALATADKVSVLASHTVAAVDSKLQAVDFKLQSVDSKLIRKRVPPHASCNCPHCPFSARPSASSHSSQSSYSTHSESARFSTSSESLPGSSVQRGNSISIVPDQLDFVPASSLHRPPQRPSRDGLDTHYNDIGVRHPSYDSGVALAPSIPVLYTYTYDPASRPTVPARSPRRVHS